MRAALFLGIWGLGMVFAQNDIRPQEPMILTGQDLPELLGVPVDQIFMFSYDGVDWQPTPFQVDERDPDGSYFNPDDGLFDANDELIWLPQYGGFHHPVGWIDDSSSTAFARLQIHITDPLSGASVFVSIHQSQTLDILGWPQLMVFDPVTHHISCEHYALEFDADSGLWTECSMNDGSGWSVDLLDREKMRLQIHVPPFFNFSFDEEDPEFLEAQICGGGVRVTRRTLSTIEFLGMPMDFVSLRHYLPNCIMTPDNAVEVNSDFDIQMVRISMDLTADASGAEVLDPNQASGLLVDGIPDLAQTAIDPGQTQAYWTEVRFQGMSLVNVVKCDGIATTYELYYHDDHSGGTADGTLDTGDGQSYGDTGLILRDLLVGEHQIVSTMMLDPEGVLDGETAKNRFLHPLQWTVQYHPMPSGSFVATWRTASQPTSMLSLVSYLNP